MQHGYWEHGTSEGYHFCKWVTVSLVQVDSRKMRKIVPRWPICKCPLKVQTSWLYRGGSSKCVVQHLGHDCFKILIGGLCICVLQVKTCTSVQEWNYMKTDRQISTYSPWYTVNNERMCPSNDCIYFVNIPD